MLATLVVANHPLEYLMIQKLRNLNSMKPFTRIERAYVATTINDDATLEMDQDETRATLAAISQ